MTALFEPVAAATVVIVVLILARRWWPVPRCSACDGPTVNVLYMAAPGQLCENDNCSTLHGAAADVTSMWFNGVFVCYEGSYFRALFSWLTNYFPTDERK